MGADDIGDDRKGGEVEQPEQGREGEEQRRIARYEHQENETEARRK